MDVSVHFQFQKECFYPYSLVYSQGRNFLSTLVATTETKSLSTYFSQVTASTSPHSHRNRSQKYLRSCPDICFNFFCGLKRGRDRSGSLGRAGSRCPATRAPIKSSPTPRNRNTFKSCHNSGITQRSKAFVPIKSQRFDFTAFPKHFVLWKHMRFFLFKNGFRFKNSICDINN